MNDLEHLMSIFPEEVWTLILNNLIEDFDGDTLESVSNASQPFRNLLSPQRVLYLFPKVWRVLAKTTYNHIHNGKSPYNEKNVATPSLRIVQLICMACGNSNDEGWYTKILKLRLVCRFWNLGVDNFYQNLEQNYQLRENLNEFNWCERHLAEQFFENQYCNIDKFLKHFAATHLDPNRNPVFGRSLGILYDIDRPPFGRELQLESLLAIWGHHFWHFKLQIIDKFPTRIDCYNKIRELLQLLPNLKTLEIRYMTERLEPEDVPLHKINHPPHSSQQFLHFEEHSNSNPLPTLRNLQFLNLSNMPSQFFDKIIKTNNHVPMLQVRQREDYNYRQAYLTPIPNLHTFSMKVYREEHFFDCANLQNWPLTKLLLDCNKMDTLDWSNLLRLLQEKWGGTLKNLVLYLPRIVGMRTSAEPIDHLALTHLTVIMQKYCHLDFILPFRKSLEVLEVKDWTGYRSTDAEYQKAQRRCEMGNADQGRIVKFLSAYDNPLESNVWDLFPQLKQLVFLEMVRPSKYFLDEPYRVVRPWEKRHGWTYTRSDWVKMRKIKDDKVEDHNENDEEEKSCMQMFSRLSFF